MRFCHHGNDLHSEGFVVEFSPPGLTPWAANFQAGGGRFYTILQHPDARNVIVVAGGHGYMIDPTSRCLKCSLGSGVATLLPLSDRSQIVIGNDLCLQLLGVNGIIWETRRISWDGIQELKQEGNQINGQAWSAIDDCWYPFTVDLDTGSVKGGAYEESWPQ